MNNTLIENIGKEYKCMNNKTKKEMSGKIIKEKIGFIWVDFGNNNIRRFKKY